MSSSLGHPPKQRQMAVAAFGLTFILLISIFASIMAISSAFTTGQSASLVIGQTGFTGGGSATTSNGLWGARDVALDQSGNLWVADSINNRVLEYVRGSGFVTSESASTLIGQSDYTHGNSGNGAYGLNVPAGLAFDSSGNLWVADQNNERVLEFAAPLTSSESASLVLGQADFAHYAPAASAGGLFSPQGLAFDSSGNLWVADKDNNRVLKYASPFSNGETASIVIGQPDFTHSSGSTTVSGLLSPTGLTFDGSGNLWVADQNNNRVLEFTPPFSTGQSSSLVLGQTGFTSSKGGTQASLFLTPARLAFDSSGKLWLSDSGNNRVLEFVPPFATGESASLVVGQSDFSGQGSATTAGGLQGPAGLAFDSSGNLWAADAGNNRVLEYLGPARTTTTSTSSSSTSATSSTTSTSITTISTTVTATVTSTTTISTTSTATTTLTTASTTTFSSTYTTTYTATTSATNTVIVTSSQTSTSTATSVTTNTQTVSATETTTRTLTATSTFTVSTTPSSASGSATAIAGGAANHGSGLSSPTIIAAFAMVAVLVLLVLLALARRAGPRRAPSAGRPSSWS